MNNSNVFNKLSNNRSNALRINQKFYYGWVIVFISALSMFFSAPGQTFSISAFIDEYIEVFGFDRTTVSAYYSIATLASACLLFLMGKLVDRYGPRLMMVIIGTSLAVAAMFNSFISSIPMIIIGFFLARYLGQGSMVLAPSTLVPQWFQKKRGFAFSIFKFGGTIASVIVPVINVYLISSLGWQMTWRVWSLLLLALFVPAAWFMVINKPEDIGLKPDNVELDESEVAAEAEEVERESWHVNEAVRTRAFWVLGFVSAITPLITTGLGFHIYSILAEKGIDKTAGAVIFGVMSIPGFFFPIIAGKIIDHVGARKILMATLFFEAIGLLLLNLSSSTAVLVTAFVVYGIGMSTQFVASGVMWPNFFGRKYLGSIQGVATIFGVAGSALGTLPFGFAYDNYDTYVGVIYIMMAVAVVGGIGAHFAVAPVKRHKSKEKKSEGNMA